MLIIGEFEPRARGAYTGCHGDPGFNRESQLSISIRTAIHNADTAYFHAGAGIVGDSIPEAEFDETMAKSRGFLAALDLSGRATGARRLPPTQLKPHARNPASEPVGIRTAASVSPLLTFQDQILFSPPNRRSHKQTR